MSSPGRNKLNSKIVVKTYNVKGLGYNFVFLNNEGYVAAVFNSKRSKNNAIVTGYSYDDSNSVYDVWFDASIATTDSIDLTVVWIKK